MNMQDDVLIKPESPDSKDRNSWLQNPRFSPTPPRKFPVFIIAYLQTIRLLIGLQMLHCFSMFSDRLSHCALNAAYSLLHVTPLAPCKNMPIASKNSLTRWESHKHPLFFSSQDGWVLLPVPWGSTKPTESPGPRSPRPSCWPWRGSSARSSTSPSPSAQSSPALSTWQRHKSKYGSRTDGRKPSGSRRRNWKNWKWQPSLCSLQLSEFPFLSVRTSRGLTVAPIRSTGTLCRCHP